MHPIKARVSNPVSSGPTGPTGTHAEDAPNPLHPIKELLTACLVDSLKVGGAPEDVAGRTLDCFRFKVGEALVFGHPDLPLGPPEPGPTKPGSLNPGTAAGK